MSSTYAEYLENAIKTRPKIVVSTVDKILFAMFPFFRKARFPGSDQWNFLLTDSKITAGELVKEFYVKLLDNLKVEDIADEHVDSVDTFFRPWKLDIRLAEREESMSMIINGKEVVAHGRTVSIMFHKETPHKRKANE